MIMLAAGEGRRLRPLTEWTPKPLLPLGAKPLIEHALDAFLPLRDVARQVEIAVNHASVEAVRAWARARLSWPNTVHDVDLGMQDVAYAGGVRLSRPVRDLLCAVRMGGCESDARWPAVVVGVCDNLWPAMPCRDVAMLVGAAIEHAGDDTLAVVGYVRDYSQGAAGRLGCLDVLSGSVLSFWEKPGAGAPDPASVFFCPMIVTPRGVSLSNNYEDCETLGEFVGKLAENGPVRAVEFFERPEDVGTIESYRAARDRLERAAIEAEEKP